MATEVSKDQLRTKLQLAFEDIALFRTEALRLVLKADERRRPLEELWNAFELGDLPEYEPEIRVRKVS